ncbi:MAG: hypothetical protein C0592_00640 [Marinilabiliales bacterium]|nr:MAG: hypothetical protein C0592_00640 [Marinilabiliales bacterium]
MRFIVISFLLAFVLKLSGQESFPLNNCSWTCSNSIYVFYPPGSPPATTIQYYKTGSDTIINGKTFTKIEQYYNGCKSFLRVSGDTVFCKYTLESGFDTTEFILYNFGLSVGDTMNITMSNDGNTIWPAEVMYIDSVLIGDTFHKRLLVNGWLYFAFVEGVGCDNGLFYNELYWVDNWGSTICYSRNDTIFSVDGSGQMNLGNCWQSIGINEPQISEPFIYPNPTKDYIQINLPNISIAKIYSAKGICVLESKKTIIDIHSLPQGIYFVQVLTANNAVYSDKLIIY